MPGTDFGCPAEDLGLRLAYVDFDGGAALAGLGEHADREYLETHCTNVIAAMRALRAWLEA